MTRTANSVFSAALALPAKKRAELAHRLIRSLDGPEPTAAEQAEIDAAWAKEIERREKEIDEGKAQLIPFEDVMAEAEEILKRPKKRKAKP